LLALFLGVCCSSHSEASTSFYVDPDWTGIQNGSASQPWNSLSANSWASINAALAADDVTIYLDALKANGTTQQTYPHFLQVRRVNTSSHRLTIDGYSQYNTNETSPSWTSNPDTDINHAYLDGKVCKVTGDGGSQGIGWTRSDGNDFVTHNGLVYCCIESHVASSDNEPGVGANWRLYWDQHGSSSTIWSSGTTYKCYPKQENVTLRGFEITGVGARAQFGGDNLIWEYNYLHDVTNIGPGMQLNYTSLPDSSAAQIISRPSTNMTFHHFKVKNTFGEGFYLGSINPDAPGSFQLAHGNQHSHILIEDFVIQNPGANGGQGDAIDCKNGVTYLTIRLGDISGFGANGNGINLPMTAINTDQHNLVERNFIHDSTHDALGAQRAIHAQTGDTTGSTLYGIVGLTIRNNVVANASLGIQVSGNTSPSQPVDQAFVFNNTVYNCSPEGDLAVNTNITNSVVKNNFAFAGSSPCAAIGSTGIVSDYNAHDGSWNSPSEGTHTLALSSTHALASVVDAVTENFHLVFGAPIIDMAQTQASFSNDFDGDPRGLLWDIGAYEFASTATPTPTPTSETK